LKEQKHDTIDWAETLKVWNCRQLYVLREQIGTLAEDLLKKRQEQKHDTIDWAETLKVWNCRQLYVLREQIVTLA
jgi:hypothetical protein